MRPARGRPAAPPSPRIGAPSCAPAAASAPRALSARHGLRPRASGAGACGPRPRSPLTVTPCRTALLSNGADTASSRKGEQSWSWRLEADFLPSNMVVNGGQTVSATRFAQLTGVSRERLRTWERRYGFPAPLRVGQGPRRYAVDDVARVVAVRQAAGAGVPLSE